MLIMYIKVASVLCGLFLMSQTQYTEFESDIPLVEAVAGGQASIPCNVTTPLEDDEATLILWYRLDMPNPIYTLDIRNAPIQNAKHFPSEEMGDRAHFDVSVHPPLLLLSDVTVKDKADYKCRVDLRRSRTLILNSRLTIIVPPNEPIIMDEHGQRLQNTVGPFDEGSTLVLVCEVDGGDPSPNVTWWRGPVLVDDSFTVIKRRFVRNELLLGKIQRTDLMTEYSCQATNTPLAKPRTAFVVLDMNLFPMEVRILGMPLYFLSGMENEIACETRGSRPRAMTSWWLNGQKILTGFTDVTKEGGNVTLSTLRLKPTPGDNGKRLVCRSVNPSLPKATFEDEEILKVQYIPVVNLSLGTGGTSKSAIQEGNKVVLECRVWANPWIYEIVWQFQDRPLNATAGILITNQSLILRSTRKEERGRYRCIAVNSVGRGYSGYHKLEVQFVPVCKSPNPKFYGVAVTETTNVTCDVEADPYDVTFRWSLETPFETVLLSNWSLDATYPYSPATERGYGTLLCWAHNSLGAQKEPCVLRIVPAGPPESPHDCLVTNQTSSSLSIECQAGYNGSLPQIFHLEVYSSVAEHMVANLSQWQKPKFRIEDLSASTSYVLLIYASNVKGRSNSVALVTTTLSPAERRTAEDDDVYFNPALGVLIGVVILLFLLTIAIVIVIRSHGSRDHTTKESGIIESSSDSILSKKELEENPEGGSNKGPDIIPLSVDPDVFFTGQIGEEVLYRCKSNGHTSPEYVHEKYTHTAL